MQQQYSINHVNSYYRWYIFLLQRFEKNSGSNFAEVKITVQTFAAILLM